MNKVIKKIKKIMAQIDSIEAKEEILREDLAEAIDELEEAVSQYYGPIHPNTAEGRLDAEGGGVFKVMNGYFIVQQNTCPDLILGHADDYVLAKTV